MNEYCVYKHTAPNGKVYIGLTGQTPRARWHCDGSGYKRQPHFWKAIRKYGWNNFTHEIVFTTASHNAAASKEIELIAEYDSANPAKGYNVTLGGDGGQLGRRLSLEHWDAIRLAHFGVPLSEEHRRRLSAAKKGKVFSAEHRRHLSEAHKGNVCKRGTKLSAESRERIRVAKLGEKNARCRRVRCVETEEEYFSAVAAAEALGLNPGPIGKACRGLLKTYHGYHWEFV